MSPAREKSLSPLSRPWLHCLALPLVALALGVALAVYEQWFDISHGRPRVWESWMALMLGAGVGIALITPQKRQLRRHRDFVASQCIRGHARGLATEILWFRVVWPMLVALSVAIGAAWWLAWPAVIAMSGALASIALLYPDCRRIRVLAKRMLAPDAKQAQ